MHSLKLWYDRFYGGSVQERFAIAHNLYSLQGACLQKNPKVVGLLSELKTLAGNVSIQMERMNMDHLCSRCGSEPNGGCCSFYMAGETDVIQLLINLLAGLKVEVQRDDGNECCYLGEQGCVFLVKPMFCLNYNCSRITSMAPLEIEQLAGVSSKLQQKQYALEGLLIRMLSDPGSACFSGDD